MSLHRLRAGILVSRVFCGPLLAAAIPSSAASTRRGFFSSSSSSNRHNGGGNDDDDTLDRDTPFAMAPLKPGERAPASHLGLSSPLPPSRHPQPLPLTPAGDYSYDASAGAEATTRLAERGMLFRAFRRAGVSLSHLRQCADLLRYHPEHPGLSGVPPAFRDLLECVVSNPTLLIDAEDAFEAATRARARARARAAASAAARLADGITIDGSSNAVSSIRSSEDDEVAEAIAAAEEEAKLPRSTRDLLDKLRTLGSNGFEASTLAAAAAHRVRLQADADAGAEAAAARAQEQINSLSVTLGGDTVAAAAAATATATGSGATSRYHPSVLAALVPPNSPPGTLPMLPVTGGEFLRARGLRDASIERELASAILAGDASAVMRLIGARANVNCYDGALHTPLAQALRTDNNRVILKLLIDAGAVVNALLPPVLVGQDPPSVAAAAAEAAAAAARAGEGPAVRSLLQRLAGGGGGGAPPSAAELRRAREDVELSALRRLLEDIDAYDPAVAASDPEVEHRHRRLLAALEAIPEATKRRFVESGGAAPRHDPFSRDALLQLAPLHLAAMSGSVENVAYLLERGAVVDCLSSRGQTPLMLATECGHAAAVELLLSRGANPNLQSRRGLSSVHAALLLGPSAAAHACLDQLLFARGDPGAAALASLDTPLVMAVRRGDVQALRFLLSYGADPRARAPSGVTPLAAVVDLGLTGTPLARALVAAGAADQRPARAALMFAAAARGRTEAVPWLVSLPGGQAAVEARDDEGVTPLMVAVQAGHAGTVASLVSVGARADSPDKAGRTPLHVAAAYGQVEVINALLAAQLRVELAEAGKAFGGGPPRAPSVGSPPASGPVWDVDSRPVTDPIALGLDPNRTTPAQQRRTALMLAARYGHLEAVRALLRGGALAGARDAEGATARDWARHAPVRRAEIEALLSAAEASEDPSAVLRHNAPAEDRAWLAEAVRASWEGRPVSLQTAARQQQQPQQQSQAQAPAHTQAQSGAAAGPAKAASSMSVSAAPRASTNSSSSSAVSGARARVTLRPAPAERGPLWHDRHSAHGDTMEARDGARRRAVMLGAQAAGAGALSLPLRQRDADQEDVAGMDEAEEGFDEDLDHGGDHGDVHGEDGEIHGFGGGDDSHVDDFISSSRALAGSSSFGTSGFRGLGLGLGGAHAGGSGDVSESDAELRGVLGSPSGGSAVATSGVDEEWLHGAGVEAAEQSLQRLDAMLAKLKAKNATTATGASAETAGAEHDGDEMRKSSGEDSA